MKCSVNFFFYRMKKKRKRSTSSSSDTSSRNSSMSSSSSRRRSKKKKKKRRSERGSKRHRRSEEGKSEKDRKAKEEDEVEWYPAPPNTSASFLTQKGGPYFGESDEAEVMVRDADDRRISQLYSLSAASEDEESDSSRRQRKGRDREESRNKGRNPEREEVRSTSRDNGKDRRNSDSKRRSSSGENRKRKVSCSSAESGYSRTSTFKSEYFGDSGSASKQVERHDSSKRNSFDGGSYECGGWEEMQEVEEARRALDNRKGKAVEDSSRSDAGGSKRADGAVNHNKQSSLTSVPEGRANKDLPSNLLDIFNQIAQFKKEKGVGPK